MNTNSKRSIIIGSERTPLHNALVAGSVPEDERFEVTVRIRRKAPIPKPAGEGFYTDTKPAKRNYPVSAEFEKTHGADLADIAKVEEFAKSNGLVVVESNAARRSVFLSGNAANFSKAFGTTIEHFEHDGGTYRGRTGPLTVPSDLAEIIVGVFGIDDRPIARPHNQFYRPKPASGIQAHRASSSFTPPELAKLYNFPTGVDGSGQCIGIIELGGGYRTKDIKTYFTKLGLPVPNVTAVRVDGAKNQPSTADSDDGEVMLDIEVAAAIAPKAKIVVYFAPNTDKGFLDAITLAVHDTTNKPSVISISWGSSEKNWTAQALNSFDQAFQTAASLGITVCCSSGDTGSSDSETDGLAHVDFPASSPHALGCGGTKLTASGTTTILNEVVWNESHDSSTGGGISGFFPVPSYQNASAIPPSANAPHKPGRGVPDISGDADPATGYTVRVDGQDFVIGGTSAVAPLWAGLIALFNQKLNHRVGYLNPLIYGSIAGSGAFRDITSGNNGAYTAKNGWDPCTGWGTPNGVNLLHALGG